MFLFTWQIIYNYITHYYISLAIRGCLACHFETVHTLISEWNLRLFWQYSRRLYFNVFACNVIDHARIHILQSCFIMFSTTFSNRLKKIVLILLRNGQHCTNFNGDSDVGIDGTVLCPSAQCCVLQHYVENSPSAIRQSGLGGFSTWPSE